MTKVTSRRPRALRPLLRLPVRQKKESTSPHHTMVRDYLEQLGTARSLAVWLIYSCGDHADLLSLPAVDFDAQFFLRREAGIGSARRDYAATKLLSCSDFLSLDVDREAVALKSGALAESHNAQTNRYLRDLRNCLIKDDEFNAVLHRAARIVSSVLGPLSSAVRQMEDVGWTSGRTSAVTSRQRSAPEKYSANLDVTGSALNLGWCLVKSSAVWSQSALQADAPCSVLPSALRVVDHNVAITVPKNAKTDRLICYEPHINIRLQRTVGVYIKSRLRSKARLDLSDQSVNQRLAHKGSLDGRLATLDLSMASDTLCTELVYDLLPIDWFEFLDSLRSRHTLWPSGQTLRNEKFSSMGNGFTFELETLVFWALASAVASEEVTAYGDDIVVSTDDFPLVVAALSKAGFKVNQEKSFSNGFFRESCGKDYYRGVDVTPVYLDHEIVNVERWILFHNSVRAYATRGGRTHHSWSWLLQSWRKTIKAYDDETDRPWKDLTIPLGPVGYGDGHFHVNFEEACPPRHPHGWYGWEFDSIVKVFTDRLTSCRLHDGSIFYVRYASEMTRLNPSCLLASAIGPKKAFSTFDLLKEVDDFRYVVRSRLFCFAEWPSVVFS